MDNLDVKEAVQKIKKKKPEIKQEPEGVDNNRKKKQKHRYARKN